MILNIQFESETCEPSDIPHENNFYRWASAIIDTSAEIGLRIVDTAEGRRLNRRFARVDHATNVLSFPFATKIPEERNYLGDILMTAPVIVREARTQNKPIRAHWAHLFIHALLHLKGYRHDDAINARKMEARESSVMQALGFSDPWLR